MIGNEAEEIVDNREVVLRINGSFAKRSDSRQTSNTNGDKLVITGQTLEIIGLETVSTAKKKAPDTINAVMILRNDKGKEIGAIKGVIGGIYNCNKPLVFSIKTQAETNLGLDFVGIITLFNDRDDFKGRFYGLVPSKILSLAILNDAPEDALRSIISMRNKEFLIFLASIQYDDTLLNIPYYNPKGINHEKIELIDNSQLRQAQL